MVHPGQRGLGSRTAAAHGLQRCTVPAQTPAAPQGRDWGVDVAHALAQRPWSHLAQRRWAHGRCRPREPEPDGDQAWGLDGVSVATMQAS